MSLAGVRALVMLYCPNPNCQSPNEDAHHFCERCRTRLPKRYLWAIGNGVDLIQVGQILGDRYLCKAPRIFLDTRPGLSPDTLDSFPDSVLPYLKLNAYQLHVPQAYGWVQPGGTQAASPPILLLEHAAIAVPIQQRVVSGPIAKAAPPTSASVQSESVHLFPTLTSQWKTASVMRQLNWLWQLVKLWQPLATERVVSSLLEPDLIRVEDSVVRLLELKLDQRVTEGVGASLFHHLGALWQQWVPDANPAIQPFLGALCEHLLEGNIKHPGQLVACLDRALSAAGESQVRRVQLASQTDQGPTRPRNEDACYPPEPGTLHLNSKRMKKADAPLESSLVVVCDGIGGHLGGAVASGLAIETIYQHLKELPLGQMSPLALTAELRKAACAANDVISDRNDQEERRDRERMGTTLVMGLVQNHELYITHLGDSRAYLVTKAGCHQVTLDDDVASREARLGYGTYRSALTHPGSGSLVQALGMGPSGSLHPTIQRFLLDGEGLMLLCSDGLSDNDLVEGIWQTYLRPLLDTGDSPDLGAIAQKLVNAANQYNGHDNVTVSLVRWVTQHPSKIKIDAKLATPPTLTSSIPGLANKTRLQSASSTALSSPPLPNDGSPTQLITPDNGSPSQPNVSPSPLGMRSLLSLLLGVFFLLSLGGVLAYVLLPSVSDRINAWLGVDGQSHSTTPASLDPDSDGSFNPNEALGSHQLELPLQVGSIIQISRSDLAHGVMEESNPGRDNGSDGGGDRPPSESNSEDNAVDTSEDNSGLMTEPAILTLYPEPFFPESISSEPASSAPVPSESELSASASSAPSLNGGEVLEGDRSTQAGTPLSSSPPSPQPPSSNPALSTASSQSPVASDASRSSPESSNSNSVDPAESLVSPMAPVTEPTPVTAGTLLRVMGQQEGDGNMRWIRLRVCHVPVKPDEAIVSGETPAPIARIESDERVLIAGQTGWIPEHHIATVAVLIPDPDETQVQGCQLSATP